MRPVFRRRCFGKSLALFRRPCQPDVNFDAESTVFPGLRIADWRRAWGLTPKRAIP